MKVTIHVDWEKDGDVEKKRTIELVEDILKRGYPIDVEVQCF